MKLFQKIALGALFIALVPLAALGFRQIAEQRQSIGKMITAEQGAEAEAAAERIARRLQEVAARIAQTLRLVDPTALAAEERTALLRAVYRQSPDIVAVAWMTPGGKLAVPLVALRPDEQSLTRIGVSAAHETRLLQAAALLSATEVSGSEVVLSEPLRLEGRRLPSLLLLMPIDKSERLIVEVALAAPEADLQRFKPQAGRYAALLDDQGAVLVASAVGLTLPAKVQRGPSVRFVNAAGEPMLGAVHTVENTRLSVIVFESESQAFSPLKRMERQTLSTLAASALLSIIVGFLLSRSLRQRLLAYEEGARAFGRGELGRRIEAGGDDELGLLAQTLNRMASDLGKSRAEIEAWNRELQARVDARTAELKSAQERLLLAARVSAVGHLGAGVAHEIGNPLARIVGHAQLLQLEDGLSDETRTSLKNIEAAAKRASEITKALLRFSETQATPTEAVSLDQCCDEAVGFLRTQYEALGLVICGKRAGGQVNGRKAQIVQALIQLLDNAKNAMLARPDRPSNKIALDTEAKAITLTDQGIGIAPELLQHLFDPFFTTKTVWENPGLGLSLVYRTMQEHGGRVDLKSELGSGTTVVLTFR